MRLLVVVAVLASGLLAGCGGGFTQHAQTACGATATMIDALSQPRHDTERLGYALDRYTLMERVTAELTDAGAPLALRTAWLRPARTSLEAGIGALERLRAGTPGAYAEALDAGTVGVETDLLARRGLGRCATLYRSPS